MIIDSHMHVWPDKIASRALGTPVDGLKRYGDGTVASASSVLEAAGIDRGVCLGVADTAPRLEAANAFVGSLPADRFIGFGSVHPDRPVDENIAILRENKLRGVKIHPLFQGYALDDRRLWDIFEAMQGEFIALMHVGEGGRPDEGKLCTPKMVRDIARNFPKLEIIAAHFGGYQVLDQAEEYVIGLPVWIDTSWPPSSGTIDPDRLRRVIERHGADRVVFASDWPMADPAAEVAAIERLGLSSADTEAILGGNLQALLGA